MKDISWKQAEYVAGLLREAGVDLVNADHVGIWREDLVKVAQAWGVREQLVRTGQEKRRFACPSFLYRLYASSSLQDELCRRGRRRWFAAEEATIVSAQ